jgi:integral membrane protein
VSGPATPTGSSGTRQPLPSGAHGALIRYRVMTYIVGSALIVLVFLGVPLQVWAHFDLVAKVEGTIHGYLYLLYLFTAADLARRARWRLGRILAVVLSGFVPGLAFVVEHRVVKQMKAEWAAEEERGDLTGPHVGSAGRGGADANASAGTDAAIAVPVQPPDGSPPPTR